MRFGKPTTGRAAHRRHRAASALALAAVLLCAAHAPADSGASATAPALFVQTALVRAELELLRYETGRPIIEHPNIMVSGAGPHDLAALAQGLVERIDRLCFELAREYTQTPDATIEGDDSARTAALLKRVIEGVRRVKQVLNIPESSLRLPLEDGKTDSDVLVELFRADRQADLLLRGHFDEPETFEQITLAVAYAAALLTKAGETSGIPQAPPLERYKRPGDVFAKLVSVHGLLRQLATRNGLTLPEIEADASSAAPITTSETYDMARLVAAALDLLGARLGVTITNVPVREPGFKLASQVYQRAGLLEAQIQRLLEIASTPPSGSDGGN